MHCIVGAKLSATDIPCNTSSSPLFFAGIKVWKIKKKFNVEITTLTSYAFCMFSFAAMNSFQGLFLKIRNVFSEIVKFFMTPR